MGVATDNQTLGGIANGKSNKAPYVFLQSLYSSGMLRNASILFRFIENRSKIYLSEINPFILCKGSSGVIG